jgi:predicted nucleotidyltransferase
MVEGGIAMVEILQNKREAIAELCDRHGVARLDVFGSALRDDYRPGESDVDLLVEFTPMDGYAKAVAYFDLLEDLRGLLGVEVDLVMAGAVKNRYIARDIERTRQQLYAA